MRETSLGLVKPSSYRRLVSMGEELCNIELGLALGGGCSHVQRPQLPSPDWFLTRMKEEYRGEEDGDEKEGARKKLRLTKEQLASLEDSFRAHNILNVNQKQDLAKQLNLKPRQVEVWFQNRRARTKLKQTEVDCEFLKKYCESLSLENQRLKKELQQLRSVKPRSPPPPLNVHRLKTAAPAAALAVCPSCERISDSKHSSRSSSSSMAC